MVKFKNMFKHSKKWKMYLYISNQCIKCIKINDEEQPFDNEYIINVFFKKHILGTNFAKIIVKPIKLKHTDNKKKSIHIETVLYNGVSYREGE